MVIILKRKSETLTRVMQAEIHPRASPRTLEKEGVGGRGVSNISPAYAVAFFMISFTWDSLTFKVDATLAMV